MATTPTQYRQRKFRAHPTRYNGVRFRSKLEALRAAQFDARGDIWLYEPFKLVFDFGEYIPDFLLLSKCNTVVEVKPQGFTSKHDYTKIADTLQAKLGWQFTLLVGLPDISYHTDQMQSCRKPRFPERVVDLTVADSSVPCSIDESTKQT